MAFKHNNKEYFGKQLIISVYGCNDNIHSIEFWKPWFSELVDLIDMKAFGPLHIDEFGENELHGISALQFIYTSSIVMHNEKRNNGVHLDVFSCKDFDEEKIIEYLAKTIEPDFRTMTKHIIYR